MLEKLKENINDNKLRGIIFMEADNIFSYRIDSRCQINVKSRIKTKSKENFGRSCKLHEAINIALNRNQ